MNEYIPEEKELLPAVARQGGGKYNLSPEQAKWLKGKIEERAAFGLPVQSALKFFGLSPEEAKKDKEGNPKFGVIPATKALDRAGVPGVKVRVTKGQVNFQKRVNPPEGTKPRKK